MRDVSSEAMKTVLIKISLSTCMLHVPLCVISVVDPDVCGRGHNAGVGLRSHVGVKPG